MTTENRLPVPEPVSASVRRADPVWRAAHLAVVARSPQWARLLSRENFSVVVGYRQLLEEQLLGAAWLSERMLIDGMGDAARDGLLRIYGAACREADPWTAAEAVWTATVAARGGR